MLIYLYHHFITKNIHGAEAFDNEIKRVLIIIDGKIYSEVHYQYIDLKQYCTITRIVSIYFLKKFRIS